MSNIEQSSSDTGRSVGGVIRTQWLNPRRKRFWAILLVLIYTLLGFFVAPGMVKDRIIGLLQDDLGRPTQIEKVEINPLVLSLSVQGFEVRDSDDVKLVAFDELFVNFQLSSLFHRAWTFAETRLEKPYFLYERHAAGDSRMDQLLADFANARPVGADDEQQAGDDDGVPRLLIHKLVLNAGHVDVKDNVPATPVETQLVPINISVQDLNTLPGRHGRQSVAIQLPHDASLKWDGSLTLAPLDSEGELVLEGLHLDPVIAYLKTMLPLESLNLRLSSRFHYRVHSADFDQFEVEVDKLEVVVDELLVSGLEPLTDFIDISKISLLGGTLRYPEQSMHIDKLVVDNPHITAWLDEDGTPAMMKLVPEGDEGADSADMDEQDIPWKLGIDEFIIADGKLALSDRSIEPGAAVGITDLQVKVAEISNVDDVLMPFDLTGRFAEGGNYEVHGTFGVYPDISVTGNATTRGVPLALGQPYIQQYAQIVVEDGVLDSDIEIAKPAGQDLTVGGSIRVPGLEINNMLDHQRLLGWDDLDIARFDLNADGLRLSQIVFEQAFGRMVIHEDKTTNLSDLVINKADEADVATGAEPEAEPMSIIIAGIRVDQASMDFSDFSLPLPFATHIDNLDGTISTIATHSNEPANIKLEGKVDEYGLARIDGSMNLFDPIRYTDITVEFRNLMMSNLSPYTVQFAGREIDEGKLDLDLGYAIEDGQMLGSNDIVLSDLELGDKVDHPDAGSLPLGLAVGLLKDANGVIKIDLPVQGNINDPEFRMGGVIWQAVTGLITKIISAPFSFLGKLIGSDSDELGQFEFLAGRADLTPPEMEKIVQLQGALQQRPELAIEIGGVSDRVIDVPALQAINMRKIVSERLGTGLGDKDEASMMLDIEFRALVEVLFAEKFPATPAASLKVEHTAAPAGDPEAKPVLDELAYTTDLWNRLQASESISDQDLENLATARAEVIRAAFLADGQFEQSRVLIAAPSEVESEDGEWVRLELAVAPD